MAKGKRKAGSSLDNSPSHLLHRVLQVALDVYVEETGADGVTQRQFAVLTAVAENEGLTQTDLVRATGIDRSTLADLVARMIAKDLLERERSATDARANTVRLAPGGWAALDAARPRVEAADRRILAMIPGNKRAGFLSVLAEVAQGAEDAKDTSGEKAAKKPREAKPKAAKAERPAKAPKPPKADKKAKKDKPPKAEKAPKPDKAAKKAAKAEKKAKGDKPAKAKKDKAKKAA